MSGQTSISKNLILQAGIAIFLWMIPFFAFADDTIGLFVEPGLTYQQYDSSINYPSPFKDSTGKVAGFGLMGRVGFHVSDLVFVALDARYSRPTFKDSTNSLNTNADQFDLGPVVGIQMPVAGLRVWATWIVASELDPGASNGFDYKFTQGDGYRVGVGFHVTMISLNLEYQKIKYAHTTVQQLGPISPGVDTSAISFNGDGWIASVSFPIEL